MIQLNNSYADYYYLKENGTIYNAAAEKIIEPDSKHIFKLKTADNKYKKVSLNTLYKELYNKKYCKDSIELLDNEEWKDIQDTNSLYQVSNKGRIKSLQGYEAILLKPYDNQGGYARVDIMAAGHRQSTLVHRLVAAAFLPLPDQAFMQLHHKDFNKSNNAADNLLWLSPAAHSQIHREHNKKEL